MLGRTQQLNPQSGAIPATSLLPTQNDLDNAGLSYYKLSGSPEEKVSLLYLVTSHAAYPQTRNGDYLLSAVIKTKDNNPRTESNKWNFIDGQVGVFGLTAQKPPQQYKEKIKIYSLTGGPTQEGFAADIIVDQTMGIIGIGVWQKGRNSQNEIQRIADTVLAKTST